MCELEQLNNVKERILSELADAEYNLNEYQEEVARFEQQLYDTTEEIDENMKKYIEEEIIPMIVGKGSRI